MTNKIHKRKQSREGSKGAKRYQRPERHIQRADFQRIEDAPLNEFELGIQRQIAVPAGILELLIEEEKRMLLDEAIQHVSFSRREQVCLRLTLMGFSAPEIGRKLRIQSSSVHLYLKRVAVKVKKYLSSKCLL